jgi:hypothetical protein
VIVFLIGGIALVFLLFGVVQFAFLFSGQSAVETGAHFAARKFAVNARTDYRRAREAALAEGKIHCGRRFGASLAGTTLTSVDVYRDGEEKAKVSSARAGEAFRIRLTHWVELAIPWVDRVLYALAPVEKATLGGRYYLILHADRWVTVE